MAMPIAKRVQKRRQLLKAQGMRPVQLWLPDTRRPGFSEECARQARLVAQSDRQDADLGAFLDQALNDLDEASGPEM